MKGHVMKGHVALILLLLGMGLTVGPGIAGAQTLNTYSSYVAGTQIHGAANHWGNSPNHHLIDTVTINVPNVQVSYASWNAASAYTSQTSRINIYDAGLHCLIGPPPPQVGCTPGLLYVHTGPLLSSQTNPTANTQVSVQLMNAQGTLCDPAPQARDSCVLPLGTYSLTTGTSETNANSMTLWSDGGVQPTGGGAEFHIANSFGDPANAFVAAVVTGASSSPVGGNTQVNLTVRMLNADTGQLIQSFVTPNPLSILVEGLITAGGTGDVCNGIHTVDSVTGGGTGSLFYTVAGLSSSCTLDSNPNNACGGNDGGCVGAGLPPMLTMLIFDQPQSGPPFNGYYCYDDRNNPNFLNECQRNNFPGPAGPQSGAHSVGMIMYNPN